MYMVADNPLALKLGENSISKLNEKVTVKFDCKATARYYLSSGQASMIVYTKQWEEVSAMNGYYEFFANNIYYVVLSGTINDFNLSLNFDYTENLSDRFNEKGYKYVKFVPEVADVYSVSGVTKYTWYYNALMQNYGKLTENETYFVRIEGTPNANYNISIARRVITLQLSTIQSVSSGLYGITINEPGSYSIMTSKGNDIIANYNILNLQRQILHENISVGGVYSIFLESSIILEFTVNGTSSIGIRVNNINSVDESRNTNLIEGVEQEVEFYKNTDNNFTFTSSAAAEYYFKFAYATTSTTFLIVVTDSDLNLVATDVLLIEPFVNDTLVKKYGIKLNLEENTRYFFNICFYNALSSSITATALISRPTIISDVTMNSSDGFRSTKIISERLSETEINIAMGHTYTFNAPGTSAVYWRVAASTPKHLYSVDGNTITIELNQSYENKMIYINFIDDTEEILTVGLKLKLPIYLAPSYAESYNKYLIWYLNENGQLSSDFKCAEQVVVYFGDYSLTANSNSLSTFDYMDKEWNTIYCTVWFNVNGYEYVLTSDVINVNRSKVYLTSVTEQLQGEGHIIIDARDSYVSDRTIIVPTRVTSVVYIGSSTVLTNIKFKFEQHNTFSLFLKNYKTISTTNTAVLDLAQVENISIWLSGDNSIKGVSSSYLIEAKKVVFSGNGNLSVIGNHGVNGIDGVDQVVASDFGERGRDGGDGTNGRDGVGALNCTSLSNKESASIILRGGDGGEGGRGGNGGNGGSGQSGVLDTQRAGDGGNGGKGGDGGNRAKGCNKEPENITVIHGFAGRGGDGGKGGDGGNAANGAITIFKNTMSASESGNGGNGGNAGYTGWGDLKPNVSNPRGGNGGNGGKGGNGAGYTHQDNNGNIYLFVDAKNGGHGGNGGKGYYGGIGGRGGSGGTGAKGRDYSFGIIASSGNKGGDGGNGGNGGDSISSVSDAGRGGSGGGGGSGGAPGQILFTSISKATYGPVGSKGQNGVYGVYVEEERPIEPACVAEGTLITLADGRQVPVESLTGNEMLLVWNLFTGTFDVAPILFIDSDPAKIYKVINLYFSDGTSVKVISEHGLWDFDLNKYVFLREDAVKYVGHWFNKQTTDENGNLSYTRVQLTGVVVQEEYTTAWSPVTYGHLCYYVNGMLSMPGATTGLINIFDVDAYTMKIIETAYDTDIAQYGLFTYDEFANIFPVSEVVFEAFGGQYLKVAIGKGILTYDMLEELISRYAVFFDTTQID